MVTPACVAMVTHLCVVLTIITYIQLSNTVTVAMFVALTFHAAVVTDVSKVTLAHVWSHTHSVWLTAFFTLWFTLHATATSKSHVSQNAFRQEIPLVLIPYCQKEVALCLALPFASVYKCEPTILDVHHKSLRHQHLSHFVDLA